MDDDHTAPDAPRGALAELERDSYSRERFVKLVGGVGAAGAFASLLAACGSSSSKSKKMKTASTASTSSTTTASTSTAASGGSGDLAIVNYALTLEYLEADFYAQVISSGLFKGKELDLIKIIGDHEAQHVTALEATAKSLGTPAAKPKTKFPLTDRASVLGLAAVVENLGASAYLGQAGRIQDPAILAAALSIHTVEARHAAALNVLTGKDFTPDGAFAKPATMEEVLPKVKPFIVA